MRGAEGGEDERRKLYVLEYFPYPSGAGLSVGHLRNYVAGDVVTRLARMRGYEVLHPMGWDAFGLPAENRARAEGRHPLETTREFANNYRRQLELVSCSYDWSREIFSCDPEYYRWTQWLFLLLYRRGLAYQGTGRQWWCAECRTVLANEQVELGALGPTCWRCNGLVERREVPQWYLRITDYAERLLQDLDSLDWPEGIVAMQRQWIGRSEGADIVFPIDGSDERITVFTTRPDTLFGATALVIAPEHASLAQLTSRENRRAVAELVGRCRTQSDVDRQSTARAPRGAFTGAYAVHPLAGYRLPVWTADYVLPEYGSGAIMAVPAHDERDAAFARAYDLPVRTVVKQKSSDDRATAGASDPRAATTGHGELVHSGRYSGLQSDEGGRAITQELAARGLGGRRVSYRLRDWSIGRQRYWGAPIPIVHCESCGPQPVPECDLPVRLPDVAAVPVPTTDAEGRPLSPLAAIPGFVETACPNCGRPARREPDTMDGFACSSWYFFRFVDPHNTEAAFDADKVRRYMPVDYYIGGAEHAVMHLLYARFWTKVLYDAGLSPVHEPFPRLRSQGMVLDKTGKKMSKSRPQHVVVPDEAVDRYGADALRAYELFIAPFDQDVRWDEEGIHGVSRWLRRVWRISQGELGSDRGRRGPQAARARAGGSARIDPAAARSEDVATGAAEARSRRDREVSTITRLRTATNLAIGQVTSALDDFRFNVAVARLMELTNELATIHAASSRDGHDDEGRSTEHARSSGTAEGQSDGWDDASRAAWDEAVDSLLKLLAPIAPHVAEELWSRRGHESSVHAASWPRPDEAQLTQRRIEIVLQVDGTVRARVEVACGTPEESLREAALADPVVRRWIAERRVRDVIVVPDRLVNVVTGD